MPERVFTPVEANSALSEVREAAERLVAARARMRELEQSQGRLAAVVGGNGGGYAVGDLGALRSELATLAETVVACVEELENLGVLVKDLDSGLVDFPARRHGEDVLLCWRVGEEAVEWWHGVADGFAGRKRVDWET